MRRRSASVRIRQGASVGCGHDGGVVDLPDVAPDLLVEQRDFYRADAVQSDRWLSSLIDSGNDDVDARTYRSGRQRVADLLAAIAPLGRVLEIAAGTGRFAQVYLPLADSAVLVDSSPESLALATERLRSAPDLWADFELIEADIFDWDTGQRTFDTILFSAWLHHVPYDVFDRFWGRVEGILAREAPWSSTFSMLGCRHRGVSTFRMPQMRTTRSMPRSMVSASVTSAVDAGGWSTTSGSPTTSPVGSVGTDGTSPFTAPAC